jgi:TRAP-type transport system periplasmic protein
MVFSDIPADEMAKMRDKVKPVVEKYTRDIGEDLMNLTRADLAKVK